MTYNLIKGFFKKLAEKENGDFYLHDKDMSIGFGVRSPNIIFKVKFNYKDNEFTIVNRTGAANFGSITCVLSKKSQPIDFEINTISHLKNVFLRRKSRFNIKSDNTNLADFLKNNTALKLLSEVADKENFSPIMTYELDGSRAISSKYHLKFKNWTQVVEPIIELHKNLIDEFEKRIQRNELVV
jgi:hypothetical protein